MNKWILLCIYGFILSAQIPIAQSQSMSIEQLINSVDPKVNMGILVLDLDTGKVLYERKAQSLFIPASNMKLFSDASALMVLGPDYRFTTQLSMKGQRIQDGRYSGDLVLHVSGDPGFSSQQLSALFHSLKPMKIKHIDGNVIIDSSLSSISPYAPGLLTEDLQYAYGAPVTPLMLDQNRVRITVNPAGKDGQVAIIEHNALYPDLKIINKVYTTTTKKACGLAFNMDSNNTLTVSGCIVRGQWAVMQNLSVHNPLLHAEQSILHILKQQGITLNGKIRLDKSPSNSLLLAEQNSVPIAQLIAETMKSSDNLYADALYLHTAAKLAGKPVNWEQAQPLIKQFLHKTIGINFDKALLVDGSGLSRFNLISPAQTVQLLRFLHQHFALTYEYIAALPVSGRDGTLQKRLKSPAQQDRVRAKTGTMRGIISLSGFMDTANGHTLAFAIYINRLPGTQSKVAQRYRYLIDALCQYFLHQNPTQAKNVVVKPSRHPLNFQGEHSQAELARRRAAQWRHLEKQIKQMAQSMNLTVVFRPRELIIYDNLPQISTVAMGLRKTFSQSPFAVILTSKDSINSKHPLPLIWQQSTSRLPDGAHRTWTIRPLADIS